MSNDEVKLPNPNAVKELRERHTKLKEDRLKNYKRLGEFFKKKTPSKKIAKSNDLPDAEF